MAQLHAKSCWKLSCTHHKVLYEICLLQFIAALCELVKLTSRVTHNPLRAQCMPANSHTLPH
jgi:hypothetical protein